MALIELENVWKVYKMGEVDVPALRGINVRIEKGDFIAITGASGSGKSTAMHIIGALDVPTKGKVFLNQRNISILGDSELAVIRGKRVGFVFQQFNLIPTLTALDNVKLPMVFQDMPENLRNKKAIELLNLVDLGDRLRHRPTELSGGEQQRVAIARALANDPEIILADEPTGNLDSKTGREIISSLKELHKKGRTVITVTHDLGIARYAKKIIKLKDGKIIR